MSVSAWLWNDFGLFLLFIWLLQRLLPGRRGLLFSVLGAATLLFIPFFGHEPRYWLCGFTPNISVPLVVLVLASVVARAGFGCFFRAYEWRVAWMAGALAATLLYPSALGLGLRNFDSYSLGWPWLDWRASALLFGFTAVATFGLIARGNRFGWVLVLTSAAYLLRIQESANFWDYLVDPLYAVISLCVCLGLVLHGKARR